MLKEYVVIQRMMVALETRMSTIEAVLLTGSIDSYESFRSYRGKLHELGMLKQDFQDLLRKVDPEDEPAGT